jgi:hypothetical protein
VHKRIEQSGRATLQLLKASGEPTGKPFIAGLSDISHYGLSFSLRISNKETAHRILGLKLNMKFELSQGETPQKIDQNGTLVGVGYPLLDDYTIHVRVDEPFGEAIVS